MARNVQVKMRPAYLLASFYTALDSYIDKFDSEPAYMVVIPDSGLSAREWLAEAYDFANQLPEQSEQLHRVAEEIVQLVHAGRYEVARRIVRSGTRAADGEIRALAGG
jgi:uncharacterized protein Usg